MRNFSIMFTLCTALTLSAQLLPPTPRAGEELLNWDCSTSTALPTGWSVRSGQWTLQEGMLHGDGTREACLLAPVEAQNVAIEVRMATLWAREPTRWAAPIGRYRGEKDAFASFTSFTNRFGRQAGNGLEIACHGRWEGSDFPWNVIAVRSFQDKQPAEASRLLRLELVGELARAFIDGQMVLESILPEQMLISGRPGFFLSGTKVALSSVRIEALPALTEQEQDVIRDARLGYPLIIAHRGDSAEYPENTLAAIVSAAELGADAVEVDVRCSKDGVPYLFHDDTLDRVSDGKGKASELTIAELTRLTVTQARTKRSAPICTLEEAIIALKGQRSFLHIDLKEARAVPAMAELLLRHEFSERTIIGCPGNIQLIKRIREALPRSQVVIISGSRSFTDAQLIDLRHAGASGISIRHSNPQMLSIRQARLHGLVIYNWTINNPDTARQVWRQGVDGIVTDRPQLIYDALRRQEAAAKLAPSKQTETKP
jgi:glycerophosphoryl diester phosphodiesterase